MRAIRNIQDAEVAFRDVFDHLDKLKTKDQNLNLNKIKNLGDAIDPQDAVTLKQLNQLRDDIVNIFKLNNLQTK